ncbi:hypothetical protein TNCV_5012501 [Trichonephila clavipes]|nr:hypothetical protein TNCV_5012501 [Trichonephila clavipes]
MSEIRFEDTKELQTAIQYLLLPNEDSNFRSLETDILGRDTFQRLKKCRIQAHYEHLSEFERGIIIGLKEAGWENRGIARHMGRRIQRLEDAGKDGLTMEDFSVMTVAIDLGLQQIGRTN